MASSPAASIPAKTACRRSEYSSGEIVGKACPLPRKGGGWGGGAGLPRVPPVRGKFSRRLGDLLRVWHEEFLLRAVEGHRRNIGPCDTHDRAVQVAESVLGDDGGDLRAESAGEIVLVHDHRLTRAARGLEDGLLVERGKRPEVDHLDTQAFALEKGCGLQAIVSHEAPREAAHVVPRPA